MAIVGSKVPDEILTTKLKNSRNFPISSIQFGPDSPFTMANGPKKVTQVWRQPLPETFSVDGFRSVFLAENDAGAY